MFHIIPHLEKFHFEYNIFSLERISLKNIIINMNSILSMTEPKQITPI